MCVVQMAFVSVATMLTVMSFKWFVAYLLVDVVSPEQLLMELCVIDDDGDEVFDMGDDGCTPPKSAVSSGLVFNTIDVYSKPPSEPNQIQTKPRIPHEEGRGKREKQSMRFFRCIFCCCWQRLMEVWRHVSRHTHGEQHRFLSLELCASKQKDTKISPIALNQSLNRNHFRLNNFDVTEEQNKTEQNN